MARISGVDLSREGRTEIGLTYIYGIDRASSNRILTTAGISPDTRVKGLTGDEAKKLVDITVETQIAEGNSRRETAMSIKGLQEIGCYRGIRHRRSLPVRGRRTETNARAYKGPRKTVANKKK